MPIVIPQQLLRLNNCKNNFCQPDIFNSLKIITTWSFKPSADDHGDYDGVIERLMGRFRFLCLCFKRRNVRRRRSSSVLMTSSIIFTSSLQLKKDLRTCSNTFACSVLVRKRHCRRLHAVFLWSCIVNRYPIPDPGGS